MAKTFPIRLEVEEIALGAVLRKLNEMPGIAKLHLDLEHGGEGNGRKELESVAKKRGENGEQVLIKLLMSGQKHVAEIMQELGWPRQRVYQTTYRLCKNKIAEKVAPKGTYRLTSKAAQHLNIDATMKALPAPAIKRGPKGRAIRGSANIVLRTILIEGPKSPSEMRQAADSLGFSPKSMTGVLTRAKRDGLIKKNGKGYELTAKGHKIDVGVSANV